MDIKFMNSKNSKILEPDRLLLHLLNNINLIKDFFSKCDQIRRNMWILSHLLKKSLIENFIFCVVLSLGFFYQKYYSDSI